MHTIGMDTYPLIADGVAAAEGEVEGRIRPFRWWIRVKPQPVLKNRPRWGRQTTLETPACAQVFAAR